ncbi:MAG: hypothetical protein JWM36_3233 [Hyphomicrobiales bacterium]|nr:hypothetical protein [Hyphomicrobiales bacterium]
MLTLKSVAGGSDDRPEEKMTSIEISKINVGERFRKDLGDIEGLARSIEAEGLLQPIGITRELRLVFGGRRLAACWRVLGWTHIEARFVDVSSIVAGEYAENEVRKDFTASERVAIAEAVRGQLGERRGGDRTESKRQNLAVCSDPPARSRDMAAERAGFGNAETLRQASAVVKLGTPELVEKMDAGEIAIAPAAEIAKQPAERQAKIVALPDAERREELQRIKAEQRRVRDEGARFEQEKGANAFSGFLQKNGRYPNAEEAATIAKVDGKITPSADGQRHTPLRPDTKEGRARKKQEAAWSNELWRVREALALLSCNEADPADLLANAGEFSKELIGENISKGHAYLNRFAKEWKRHAE